MALDSEIADLKALRTGDQDAFQRLFKRYYPMVLRSVVYRCGPGRNAEDLVQEAFLRVWERRGKVEAKGSFFAFVETIAKNLLKDHYKHLAVREKYRDRVTREDVDPSLSPLESLGEKQLRMRIRRTVAEKLPDKCRQIFLLSRVENLSNKEVAEMLKLSPKTVENQIGRALKILKKHHGAELL